MDLDAGLNYPRIRIFARLSQKLWIQPLPTRSNSLNLQHSMAILPSRSLDLQILHLRRCPHRQGIPILTRVASMSYSYTRLRPSRVLTHPVIVSDQPTMGEHGTRSHRPVDRRDIPIGRRQSQTLQTPAVAAAPVVQIPTSPHR